MRADVAGYALGHAIGWFIAERGDSAWIFVDGKPPKSNDAIAFLATRSGIARETAMARIAEGFETRRLGCPPAASPAPVAGATPPSAAASAPARGSP